MIMIHDENDAVWHIPLIAFLHLNHICVYKHLGIYSIQNVLLHLNHVFMFKNTFYAQLYKNCILNYTFTGKYVILHIICHYNIKCKNTIYM